MPTPPQTLLIDSTKYNGSPHYRFEAQVIDMVGTAIRVAVPAGTPYEGYRGAGEMHTAFTGIYYTDRWYNIFHNQFATPRSRIVSYVNIGMPATVKDGVLRWVDLDLDVIVVENGAVVLIDQDEFAEHSARWKYPPELVAQARATAGDVLRLARSAVPPFDRETHVRDYQALLDRLTDSGNPPAHQRTAQE